MMSTEDVDPRFTDLDAWPIASAVEAMWDGQMSAIAAVREVLPVVTAAIISAAERMQLGGRLVYVGAGTSGRVAVQDGVELSPTFDWPRDRLVFVLAGGTDALLASIEGAEDDTADAVRQIDEAAIGAADVVIGVAASGTTPFTVAGVSQAAARGALTIGIASNPATPLLAAAHHGVPILTGSELIAGSTRMKAGTAQKVVLNLISTGIMLKLGRVHRGMMVNMHSASAKLKRRAEDIVMRIAGCDEQTAATALREAGADIKLAALIALGHGRDDAVARLKRNGNNLRQALVDEGTP
jgi:N-acetylmuramic acid 6-phosphate etherase